MDVVAVLAATGLVGHFINSKITKKDNFGVESCDDGYEWNDDAEACVTECEDGYKYSTISSACVTEDEYNVEIATAKQTAQREVIEVGGDPAATYRINDNLMFYDNKAVHKAVEGTNELPENLLQNRSMQDYISNNMVSPFVRNPNQSSYDINQRRNVNPLSRKLNRHTGNLRKLKKREQEAAFPGEETKQNIHGSTIVPRDIDQFKKQLSDNRAYETPIESQQVGPGISRDPNYMSKGLHPEFRIMPK